MQLYPQKVVVALATTHFKTSVFFHSSFSTSPLFPKKLNFPKIRIKVGYASKSSVCYCGPATYRKMLIESQKQDGKQKAANNIFDRDCIFTFNCLLKWHVICLLRFNNEQLLGNRNF